MGFWAASPMDGMEENNEDVSVYEVDNDNVSDVLNQKNKTAPDPIIPDAKPSEESKDETKAAIDKLAKAEPKETESEEKETKVTKESNKKSDTTAVLIIPEGIELIGDIQVNNTICIQGSVSGSIKAKSVVIEQGKQQIPTIEASSLVVDKNAKVITRNVKVEDELTVKGAIKGDIVTNSIHLDASAVVSGNISANHLNISDSAKIKGEIRFNSTESKDVDAVFED